MHAQHEATTPISRRAVLQATGGGAALAAALLAQGLRPGVARARNQSSLVGAWDCRDVLSDPPRLFLSIYYADGAFLLIPSSPFSGFGVGAWTGIGERQLTVTDRRFRYDAEGRLIGRLTVRANVALDESGDAFTGRSVVEQYDLDGNLIGTGGGPFVGTRIVPEPL